jgi:hypothetical protein
MVGHGQVLLHLVELARQDGVERVFLAVDGAGLERAEQLREGQRHRVGAQGLEAVEEDVVLHHAQLDARQVLHLADRALAVGQVAKTVLPVDQADQALVLQLGAHLVADRAVEQGVGFLGAVEQERRVPQRHFLADADQGRGRADHHLLRAADQRLLHLGIGPERGRADRAHPHLAARGLLDLFGEQLGGAALVALLVEAVAEADQARLEVLRLGHEGRCQRQRGSRGHEGATEHSHGSLLGESQFWRGLNG